MHVEAKCGGYYLLGSLAQFVTAWQRGGGFYSVIRSFEAIRPGATEPSMAAGQHKQPGRRSDCPAKSHR